MLKRMTRKEALLAFAAAPLMGSTAAGAARVYELRTYHCEPGKLPDLLARFRNHTTHLFEKHGLVSIGYFVPSDGEAHINTLVYILAHPSREAAKQNWDAFRADPDWVKAKAESEVNGKLVAKVESVYLDPTDFSKLK
jgi:hypothetical protein